MRPARNIELDELAAALDRAAASRHAQASPDPTTLKTELTDELERLRWSGGNRTRATFRTLPSALEREPSSARPWRMSSTAAAERTLTDMRKIQTQGVHHITLTGADRKT